MNGIIRRGTHVLRQLFDNESWTYTYLLACAKTKEAVLIDPVDIQVERDLKLIHELGLKLKYAVNTHCHADHITGTGILKNETGCQSMIGKESKAEADLLLNDGDQIKYGEQSLEAVSTPGHTDENCLNMFTAEKILAPLHKLPMMRYLIIADFLKGCMTFVNHQERFAMTGDALLIRACGRTDFQQGDPRILYKSVTKRIFTLPEDFYLYPAHDYKGHSRTTVAEEKQHNPRLTKTENEFVEIMKSLGLAYPKKIDEALPWNLKCGPSQLGQLRMDGE